VSRLLIVHHTPSPHCQDLFEAVVAGATDPDIEGVEVVRRPALTLSPVDFLQADGYLLGSPANLGYLSGALKHLSVGYPALDVGSVRTATESVGLNRCEIVTRTRLCLREMGRLTDVAIPDFQTLMRPVLVHVADGQVHRSREIAEAMSDQFDLTAEERVEMLPSGTAKKMANRVGWTLTHLTQAGLIDSAGRGLKVISAQGRAALDKHPERIDMKVLERYAAYVEFRDRKREKTDGADDAGSTVTPPIADDSRTPNELVESAVLVNRAAVESEVLSAALKLTPTGFEELVIRLLDRMGYGKAGSVNRTAPSGDAGIDGIISQDPLGLDRIYVQAKRFTDTAVDRPKIHEFAGALPGKQGDRGVFITTSRFTSGARQEADRINARIELIDGARLAELLVLYGVGVQPEETVTLYRLDEDFFDSI
jgi:restriction system protein